MLVEHSIHHFRATCVGCGADAEFCPRRSMHIDDRFRAVAAFRRAGWECEMPYDHRLRQRDYEAALARGDGDWKCPECVRLADPTRASKRPPR